MSLRSHPARRLGVLLAAAAAGVFGAAAAPATAATPTEAELIGLIDGRIAGLDSVGPAGFNIRSSPDGQRVAFIANIKDPERAGFVNEAVWLIAADGSKLQQVEGEATGGSREYESFGLPQWSPKGRYLTYNYSFPHAPRAVTKLADVSGPAPVALEGLRGTEVAFSADEQYGVVKTSNTGGPPDVIAYELATGRLSTAQHARDATPRAGDWSWVGSCTGAAKAGVAATGSTREVAAQFAGPKPGCRILPAEPSAAQITEIVDGRIPGLLGIGEVSVRPSLNQIAFVAHVDPPNGYTSTDQIWVVGAGGAELRRIEGSMALGAPLDTADTVAYEISQLTWGPGGYVSYFLTRGRDSAGEPGYWSVVDVDGPVLSIARKVFAERVRTSGDGRYVAALVRDAPSGGHVEVFDLNWGYSATVLRDNPGSGTATNWRWTPACSEAGPALTGDPLAAALAQLDEQPYGCEITDPAGVDPPLPIEAYELARAIDGRIPGLAGFSDIAEAPDGSKVAFRVAIHHPESVSFEDAIWLANADGSGLRLVKELGPGFSQHNSSLALTGWSPSGRFLTYAEYGTSTPRSVFRFVDTGAGTAAPQLPSASGGLAFSSDDRVAVYATRSDGGAPPEVIAAPIDGGQPFTLLTQRRTQDSFVWEWTGACRVAADAGIATPAPGPDVLAEVAKLLVGDAPGCARPSAVGPEPTTPQPTTPQPATPIAPVLTDLSAKPTGETPPPAHGAAAPAPIPQVVVSKRLVRRGGKLTALRLKVATAGASRVKVYVIGSSAGRQTTLGRASAKAQGATTTVTVPLGKAANAAARRSASRTVTVRVVTTTSAGKATTTEFALDLA